MGDRDESSGSSDLQAAQDKSSGTPIPQGKNKRKRKHEKSKLPLCDKHKESCGTPVPLPKCEAPVFDMTKEDKDVDPIRCSFIADEDLDTDGEEELLGDPKPKDDFIEFRSTEDLPEHLHVPIELNPEVPEEKAKATCIIENTRRDRHNLLYKLVPSHIFEIDILFYNKAGTPIHEVLNFSSVDLKRTLCYRTLPNSMRSYWPLVHRIVTLGRTKEGKVKNKIRDVRRIDVQGDDNLNEPCLSPDHYFTHFAKDPRCEICNRWRIQKKQRRRMQVERKTFSDWAEPANFGDVVTADFKVIA